MFDLSAYYASWFQHDYEFFLQDVKSSNLYDKLIKKYLNESEEITLQRFCFNIYCQAYYENQVTIEEFEGDYYLAFINQDQYLNNFLSNGNN